MALSPQSPAIKSLLIIGSGITGLSLALAAQARGLAVTVVSRDPLEATASGVAAGMIAPALEALGEPEPAVAYARFKRAQAAWFDLMDVWPDSVRHNLAVGHSGPTLYVWPQSDNASDITTPRLKDMGAAFHALSDAELVAHGIAADCDGVRIEGEGIVPAQPVLTAMQTQFLTNGAQVTTGDVVTVEGNRVHLRQGSWLNADAVVVAGGYGSRAFAPQVRSLKHLAPVKGHLLDLPAAHPGIVRSPSGYLAGFGSAAKFGATMQFSQDDEAIEADIVADLKNRAHQMLPDLDLTGAIARVGVRAATPDSWPLIGRDAESGVYVATGMRRNGYIFAPYAARVLLAMLGGEALPHDAELYDPNRF